MIATNYTAVVTDIISRVKITADDQFTINGKLFTVSQRTAYQQWNRPMHSFGENTGDDVRKREKLVAELTSSLYATFYVAGNSEGEWFEENNQPSAEEKNSFMNQLSAANQTVETWDPHWAVVSTDTSGMVYVQKNNVFRTLVANEWKPEQTMNGPLQPGNNVTLLNRKERRDLQPVFYYVYGKEFMPLGGSLGRFYFNVLPNAMADFIQALTGTFNKVKVPFMFKCLNHPKLYVRTDSAVLYIEKKHFTITSRLLKQILHNNQQFFKQLVPLFTKPLIHGVAYAEDPGNGKSFGIFWSEMMAEAMVKAYEKNKTEPNDIKTLVFAEFTKNGVDIERPYLRNNSFFPYDFSLLQ